jgi:hypothetical protein
LLTSRRFNKQPDDQDPPISVLILVSIAFALSNLATFVKEPLYKSSLRRCKENTHHKEDIQRSPHHIEEKESSLRHHRHPFLHLIAIAIYL